jgi:hypothetical protein
MDYATGEEQGSSSYYPAAVVAALLATVAAPFCRRRAWSRVLGFPLGLMLTVVVMMLAMLTDPCTALFYD